MNAEIISVGTELLLGEVADTNSTYLASQLPLVGASLRWITVVGDDMARLVEAFQRAWGRADLILATGGLGPTQDDLTREAIARTLGEKMDICEALVEHLRAMFATMGRSMPDANIKQASLIPSAQPIANPRGTAPGWWVEKDGRVLVAMPGPPGEMQRMWGREVMPKLEKRDRGQVIMCRALKCFGLSEAEMGVKVADLLGLGDPEVGVYAKPDGIHVRMIARAATSDEASRMIARSEATLRGTLGDYIWGADDDSLEGTVGELMNRRGLTLATMESCTGGLLGSMLTDVAGSSAYYRGGFVAYSVEAKVAMGLDVALVEQYGTVSHEVARAMAEEARRHLEADIGVATTGVAGPDSLEGKPPGLAFIGICDSLGQESVEVRYPPARAEVKRRVAIHALFLLRQRLLAL